MFTKFLKALIKWLLVVIIVGTIVWMTSSLYNFIKRKVKGH